MPAVELETSCVLLRATVMAIAMAASACTPPDEARDPSSAPAAPAAATGGPAMRVVILYGASWCGPCHMAQAHLQHRGVPFIDKDIERDPRAERELLQKLQAIGADAQRIGIPVIDVGGRILFGYDPDALDQALAAFRVRPP